MLNWITIKQDMYINVSLMELTLTLVMSGYMNSNSNRSSTGLALAEAAKEVLTTIIFPYTRCVR